MLKLFWLAKSSDLNKWYSYKTFCDCNWTQTQNHLVLKWTRTKWSWVQVQLQSLNLQILCLLWAKSSLTFRQLYSVDALWNVFLTWQEHTVKTFCYWETGLDAKGKLVRIFRILIYTLFFNWDLLHARLNSHYEALKYKKKKHKKIKAYKKDI